MHNSCLECWNEPAVAQSLMFAFLNKLEGLFERQIDDDLGIEVDIKNRKIYD